jgi:dephospho-CoA kinase
VILVGLTGGIGAGKSSVSTLLAARGAVIVDADAITRELQAPGSPVLAAIADRFGAAMVAADGSLDRAALAGVVFGDADALAALNKIVHPAVRHEMDRRIDDEVSTDHVVVLDIPLLAENPRAGLAATIVVDCPVEVAIERLVRHRGFTEDDARARVARQASRETRLALATRVVDNSGGHADLERQVDDLWRWLRTLPPTTAEDLAAYRSPPKATPSS